MNERYWADDEYWTVALENIISLRDKGETKIVLDLNEIASVIYDGDGPAYRLMDAMASVQEFERYDGCRGAPRLVLALIYRLSQLNK